MAEHFILDRQLEQDCLFVEELKHCRLLLLDDSRWPWLVLVPRFPGIEEIHELSAGNQVAVSQEISKVSQALKEITSCEKINIGALGNIVRQLHIHVIARNTGDENWPGPVWGCGIRRAYEPDEQEELIKSIKGKLK